MTDPFVNDELRFDIIAVVEGKLTRIFENTSLTVAEILSGSERDEFDKAIMHRGWAAVSPAWTSFRPMAIVPHRELLRKEQFAFLMEIE